MKPLTPRQNELLNIITRGHSNKEAAVLMRVSVKTVENIRKRLYDRMSVHNVVDMYKTAIRNRLVKCPCKSL